jgi:hypothetical protein
VDWAQEQLLERVVVPAAAELGVEKEYRYLRPSIKKFPTGEFGEILELCVVLPLFCTYKYI